MARDPDTQMVVFKDTRGRRTASQRIRDWVHIFKGARGAGDAVSGVVRGIAEASLFGGLVYLGRPKLYVYPWIESRFPQPRSRLLYSPDGSESLVTAFSYMGRVVDQIDMGHPDAPLLGWIGQLTILATTEEPGLFGAVETAGGMLIYQTLLHGLNPGDNALMASRTWSAETIGGWVQQEIDALRLPWPLQNLKYTASGRAYVPVDAYVLRQYVPRWLYDVAHAAFLDLLLHRKLGSPTAPE